MAQIVDIDHWLSAPKRPDRLTQIERDLEADLAEPIADPAPSVIPPMPPDRPRRPLPWDGRRD